MILNGCLLALEFDKHTDLFVQFQFIYDQEEKEYHGLNLWIFQPGFNSPAIRCQNEA